MSSPDECVCVLGEGIEDFGCGLLIDEVESEVAGDVAERERDLRSVQSTISQIGGGHVAGKRCIRGSL